MKVTIFDLLTPEEIIQVKTITDVRNCLFQDVTKYELFELYQILASKDLKDLVKSATEKACFSLCVLAEREKKKLAA